MVTPKDLIPSAEKATKAIVKYLKQQNEEYSVYFSRDIDEFTTNVRDLFSNGEYEYVIVGNDETLHSFINCFKDLAKIKFGIIPIGDKCDFAKFLKLESHPVRAIQRIVERKIENVDYLQVNDKRVLNNVLIGASVETEIAFAQYKIKNAISKRVAEINHGQKFNGIELTLDIKNEKKISENFFELIIANGGLSDGKSVSPLSNMCDGLFNVNYSLASNPKEKKDFTKELNSGKHVYNEGVAQLWTNNLKVTNSDKKIKALVDGVFTVFEDIVVTMVEAGLKIYM